MSIGRMYRKKPPGTGAFWNGENWEFGMGNWEWGIAPYRLVCALGTSPGGGGRGSLPPTGEVARSADRGA